MCCHEKESISLCGARAEILAFHWALKERGVCSQVELHLGMTFCANGPSFSIPEETALRTGRTEVPIGDIANFLLSKRVLQLLGLTFRSADHLPPDNFSPSS